MRFVFFIIFVLFAYFFGAVQHEIDLARNYEKTGDACGWFVEIKR
jgi:hypothetical protein